MQRFIYGQRNGIYIIDLQHTLRRMYRAYGQVRDVVANGGNVLFVGTKKQAQEPIQAEANRCGMFYVTNRWLGGTLTNYQTVQRSIQELQNLQEMDESGKLEKYGKKEAIVKRKRRAKLEKNLSGIQKMPGLPDIVFVIDAKREEIAVSEAKRLNIPCIAVVDTNCDPDMVKFPIPGNDDAIRAIQLYCSVIADAVLEGRMLAEKLRGDAERERAMKKRAGQSVHEGDTGEDDEDEGGVEAVETTRSKGETPAPEHDLAAVAAEENSDQSGADAAVADEE